MEKEATEKQTEQQLKKMSELRDEVLGIVNKYNRLSKKNDLPTRLELAESETRK